MASTVGPAPLRNEEATSAPRSGQVGVLPVEELVNEHGPLDHEARLRIAVVCPYCSNYGTIEGIGAEYRNITKMIGPTYECSHCSWRPSDVRDTPQQWHVYYSGRLGGTLVFAVNEEHMDILVQYLEAPPKRRKKVEFPWEYKALMSRLPHDVTSGRVRNDMVSLIKKLQKTRPRGI